MKQYVVTDEDIEHVDFICEKYTETSESFSRIYRRMIALDNALCETLREIKNNEGDFQSIITLVEQFEPLCSKEL